MRPGRAHSTAAQPRRRHRSSAAAAAGCPCCEVSFASLLVDAESPEAVARREARQAELRHWRHQMAAAIAAEDHDAAARARNELYRLVGDCPPFGA